jgi:glyceraldehyde 3-phosphate dehydrogenase
MPLHASLNGFGRFGFHFLRYYLLNIEQTEFDLKHINDEFLDVETMFKIIKNDPYVHLGKDWSITFYESIMLVETKNFRKEIIFSNHSLANFLHDKQGILLECSGKYTNIANFPNLERITRVYISATSLSADATLLTGFNTDAYIPGSKFISYGSCTVNAYVPLAAAIDSAFKIEESDVNVIHNVPSYLLRENPELFERRNCTLTFMAPRLLPFLNEENFNVNYTIVPVSGVSRIDFRFKLKDKFSLGEVMEAIENIKGESNQSLYTVKEFDNGPYESLLTPYSAEILLDQSRIAGKNLYLSAYFDTENSVNRYYDLINWLESGELTYEPNKN